MKGRRPDVRYYRYRGLAVRLVDGRLEAVRVGGALCPTEGGRIARARRSLAPLPKRLRAQARHLERDAEDRARRARLAEQGVEVPNAPEWGTVAVPSGVTL